MDEKKLKALISFCEDIEAQLDRLDLRKLSTGKGMYDYKLIKIVLEKELKDLNATP